jgi:hypothetical protein
MLPASRQGLASSALDTLCTGLHNTGSCARAIEAYQLAHLSVAVVRRGDTLLITLANGQVATFVDSLVDGEAYVQFSYRDYLSAIGCHLLHEQYYEGEGFRLVHDATGIEIALESLPAISTHGSFVATAGCGLINAYETQRVQIFRVSPPSPKEETRLPLWTDFRHPFPEMENWCPASINWAADSLLVVTVAGYATMPTGQTEFRTMEEPLLVELRDAKWTVRATWQRSLTTQ